MVSSHTDTFPEPNGPLATALIAEHESIDAGIEAFVHHVRTQPSSATVEDVDAFAAPLFDAMKALRRHIYLEEEFIFPLLSHGGRMVAIMVMYREHGEIWRAMDRIESFLSSDTSEAVEQCLEMLKLLETHNEKEEPVIYPHIDSELSADKQQQLDNFIVSGHMPEGWVCKAA